VVVSALLTELTANTTYHVRISATNAGGTSYGSDETFTTLGEPVSCASNTGTVTLSPGLTGTPAVQTLKIKGTLMGCTGEPFTEVAYTATLKTAEPVSCSMLTGAGEAASGAATYKWTPKTKPSVATGTLNVRSGKRPSCAFDALRDALAELRERSDLWSQSQQEKR